MSVRRRLQRLLCLMGRRPELLCGALALSCGLLLVLRITCSRAKDVIMPPRPPVHFFSTRSPVVDLFRGQLDYAEHIRQDSEVTMFFLYAPWCGQSIAARAEIEQVANRLADQVLFVAVNCWWHQGKCRKQKSFFYFPVINLYHKSFGPIEYKGPMTAAYIEKFVRRVMTPLLYIPSLPRLQDFLSHYEPGVLGYFEFNASPQPPGYLTFLSSALHSLQKDYVGTIRFGVITDRKLAKELSLTNPGSVYLHRNINSSLVYPDKEMNFTAVNICKWALDNRETLLRWLRPHGGKSLLLQNELKKGPALFMFLPFNPLAENQPLLHEITEMTIRYNRCTQSQNAQEGKAMQPVDTKPSSDSSSHHTVTHKTFSCCNTVVLPQWHLISMFHNVCELCVNQTAGIKPSKVSAPRCNFLVIQAALDSFYLKEQFFLGFRSAVRECSNFLSFYSPFNHYTACCQTVKRGIITSNTGHTTTQSVRASDLGLYKEEAPRLLPHIEEQILEPPTHHHHHISSNGIDGLRCRTNKTLNLYLLDSNLSWLYAERLGASRSSWDRSFAAIVDVKEEIHYVLDQSQPLIRPNIGCAAAVLYGLVRLLCSSDHIFIRLAQLLATDSLIVARINVAQNDLPWEFMADHIPTIIFFPQNRKANSVKYPDAQPITLPKLLRFILKHASLPPAAEPPPSCPGHYLSYKANHVSLLEREIQRLRAEIEVLHRAQEQLAGHIAEARRDKQDLKAQKQMLEEHNKALEIHKGQFQALYEERTREVGSMADKLKELAAASQSLLAENTMLRFIMASMEDKGRTKPDPEGTPTPEDGTPTPEDGIRPVLGSTEHSDSSPAEASLTLDQARENQTD